MNTLELFQDNARPRLEIWKNGKMLHEKGALKICGKFTGENSCRSVISIKLRGIFIEITLWHGCSPVNLLHIFRTSFSENTSEGLLLSAVELQRKQTKNKHFELVKFWKSVTKRIDLFFRARYGISTGLNCSVWDTNILGVY